MNDDQIRVKQYLGQYRYILRKIDRLEEELDEWQSRAEKITPILSDMPRGGESAGFPEIVEKIMGIEEDINREIEEAQKTKKEILKSVDDMADEKQREILRLRYINGLKWEKIGTRLCMDCRWIMRLHAKALNNLSLTMESHVDK